MRITEIKLNNYRAFYGEYTISLDKEGKNLMVYGENGSGKSSLFTALQNFFLSSVQKVHVEENIFVPPYKKNQKEITSEDYWLAITTQTNLDTELIKEIEIHRGTVMNPFSHYNLEKPEFEQELKDTIDSIEKLIVIITLPHTEPNFLKKDTTIRQLQNKIKSLENTVSIKDKIIGELRELNNK